MIHVPAPDAFLVFGLPRTLDLDAAALEQRYLRLSRECHPDLNRARDTADCIAVLQRAAEINNAWQVLRDPWQRARALIELECPGALQRNQKLDTAFLVEALEIAEAVASASPDAVPGLRRRIQALLDDDHRQVRDAVARRDFDAAARRLHAAHYHQKALRDLEAKA